MDLMTGMDRGKDRSQAPANVPSRCISLVTSFASCVRAEGCYGISNGKEPTSVVSVVEKLRGECRVSFVQSCR